MTNDLSASNQLLTLWCTLKMNLLSFVSVLCIFCNTVVAYKILGVFPIASKSNYNIGLNLLKGLAKEGHDVTMISPFKEKHPIPNYKEVVLENSWVASRKGKACIFISFMCCLVEYIFPSPQKLQRIIFWTSIIYIFGTLF